MAQYSFGVAAVLIAYEFLEDMEFLLLDPVSALLPAIVTAFIAVGAT